MGGGGGPHMAAKSQTRSSLLFSSSSLLMGCLLAYSASVQLNDPDWYLWLPLYALASAVNLLTTRLSSGVISGAGQMVMWAGVFLFARVLVEACGVHGMAGLWSLDLEERVVREKLGSGLVVVSMFLQLQASPMAPYPTKRTKGGSDSNSWVSYGMAALVAVAFGLTFWFFVFAKEIRK